MLVIAEEEDDSPRYTLEEVRAELEALSDDDMRRINAVARNLAGIAGMTAEDLRQEAFVRMLTTRSCSKEYDMLHYAVGVMKSISSTAARVTKKFAAGGNVHVRLVANDGIGIDIPADQVTPESEALSKLWHGASLARVADAISDDEQLQFLVEGLYDGFRGDKLEELLSTDTKGFDAARRRLARRMLKAFPTGRPI